MNVLAWRHHFPIISLWEIFRRSMAPNSEGSVSRFIKHLSGLNSKQHEVHYYNSYYIHTLIKQRNKTNGSTQSCLFDPTFKHQTLDVPFTRRHIHTSDMDTHVHICTIALQHIRIIKIKIQANTLIFCVGENIIIYTIIHVTSVPIWPKFELVQDFMPVLLLASLTKIRLKMKASAWRHRFHHYKSMGAFCCYGNHSFGGICSLFPIPLMIHIKFLSRLAN